VECGKLKVALRENGPFDPRNTKGGLSVSRIQKGGSWGGGEGKRVTGSAPLDKKRRGAKSKKASQFGKDCSAKKGVGGGTGGGADNGGRLSTMSSSLEGEISKGQTTGKREKRVKKREKREGTREAQNRECGPLKLTIQTGQKREEREIQKGAKCDEGAPGFGTEGPKRKDFCFVYKGKEILHRRGHTLWVPGQGRDWGGKGMERRHRNSRVDLMMGPNRAQSKTPKDRGEC